MKTIAKLCMPLAAGVLMAGAASAAKVSTISQHGVSWTFAQAVEAGRYANGDWWVLGPVKIVSITPNYTGSRNGWEVNPSDIVAQGFDSRIPDFDSSLVPQLPYVANPGQSLVKATSVDGSKCRPCLQTAVVLTVVASPPPSGGQDSFRPPYFGNEKPNRSVDDLDVASLPALPAVSGAPSLSWMEDRFQKVWLDHKNNWKGRYMHPVDNMPEYGASIATETSEAALRLMLDGPIDAKMPALIRYVQLGIDWYQILKEGGSWPANGGHGVGRKLPIIFASVLLGDQKMQEVIRTAPTDAFHEDGQTYHGLHGVPLWGRECSEAAYWKRVLTGSGTADCRDPFEVIDGGDNPGQQGGYQFCCSSQPFKGAALAAWLLPNAKRIWDHEPFFEYVRRWVEFGAWTDPDPCSLTQTTSLAAECLERLGRFGALHGTNADEGFYGSNFVNEMWTAHSWQFLGK